MIHCTKSACRIICMLFQQTSPKRWFANVNMTSYCDVTNSAFSVLMTTIRHCSILKFSRGACNHAVAPGITRPLHATVWNGTLTMKEAMLLTSSKCQKQRKSRIHLNRKCQALNNYRKSATCEVDRKHIMCFNRKSICGRGFTLYYKSVPNSY